MPAARSAGHAFSAGPSSTSCGRNSATGPGRPVVAIRKAWPTRAGIAAASGTRACHLVTGASRLAWSSACEAALRYRCGASRAGSADQCDHRNRRAECLSEPGGQLGRTRPDRRVADSHQPGHPRVGVGGVGRRTLVPDQDVTQGGFPVQDPVVQGEGLPAGYAEHVPDAVLSQQPGEQRAAVPGQRDRRGGVRRPRLASHAASRLPNGPSATRRLPAQTRFRTGPPTLAVFSLAMQPFATALSPAARKFVKRRAAAVRAAAPGSGRQAVRRSPPGHGASGRPGRGGQDRRKIMAKHWRRWRCK